MELTKEEAMEHAGLVRDVEAAIGTHDVKEADKPFIDAVCKRAAVELPRMMITHVRRLYEATAAAKFPSDTVCALRTRVQYRLGEHHKLKELRTYSIEKGGRKP